MTVRELILALADVKDKELEVKVLSEGLRKEYKRVVNVIEINNDHNKFVELEY